MDQIELKRGTDHRAIVVDPTDSKTSFATAHGVIDEWARTPFSETVESERMAAEARVNTAEEQLAQANKARDDLAARYNPADNTPKGATTKRTGNQKKKAPAKKAAKRGKRN